jgi:hypothetical protein
MKSDCFMILPWMILSAFHTDGKKIAQPDAGPPMGGISVTQPPPHYFLDGLLFRVGFEFAACVGRGDLRAGRDGFMARLVDICRAAS